MLFVEYTRDGIDSMNYIPSQVIMTPNMELNGLAPMKAAGREEIVLKNCVGKPLSHEDMERLLDDYYEERGWEVESGIPSKNKLTDL